MKMCTFLHFWELKAKATEEESQQRRRRMSPASIMESLWFTDESLPADQSREGVDSFSGLFLSGEVTACSGHSHWLVAE